MKNNAVSATLVTTALLLFGCSSSTTSGGTAGDGGGPGVAQEVCDSKKRPILFVHGYIGSGDNFEAPAERFTSNGYCRSAIRTYDYDSYDYGFSPTDQLKAEVAGGLDAAVDALRTAAGVDKIDLVGHSLGTLVTATYLSDAAHAAKIAHWAQAAGGGVPAPVPQVNLSSDGDKIAGPRKTATGADAVNPDIGYHDHNDVLASKESFAAMYQEFNGAPPDHPDIVPEDHIEVSGFYKNFSDNTPHAGEKIGVYEVDSATGKRLRDKADTEFVVPDDGAYGPFVAKAGARYEIFLPAAGEAHPDGTARPQHVYVGPFVRSTHLLYLKAYPKVGTGGESVLKGKLHYDDTESGFIVERFRHAMISKQDTSDTGGNANDTMTVDGSEVLTTAVAPETKTLAALFVLDDKLDKKSDLTPIANMNTLPFLNGVDVALLSSDPGPIKIVFDGTTINIPRWKSDTEGTSFVLLDN
jgi:pimeloyl-ACP methyl ester carboxylesterase